MTILDPAQRRILSLGSLWGRGQRISLRFSCLVSEASADSAKTKQVVRSGIRRLADDAQG